MTVKESYDVAGMPTTWGAPELKDNRAVAQCACRGPPARRGRGALRQEHVPLMLADWQSYNAVYGSTNNPWDLGRTPGGSSGGSAAALAAGLTGIEAGSDIGASIRNPAHYCGVFGHKPTYGIVPPRGQSLPGRVAQPDIAVIGPLARSADDLALGLSAMAGADEIDGLAGSSACPRRGGSSSASTRLPSCSPTPAPRSTRRCRIGSRRSPTSSRRRRRGVSDRARPDIDTGEADRVYIQLLRSATSGRQTDDELAKNLEITRRLAPGDDSYYARMMRGNTLMHRDWLAFDEARHKMRWKWHAFFEEWDLLLCPPAASAAFPHDQQGERYERTIRVNGKDVPTTDQLFWAGYPGEVYLPATVAPDRLHALGIAGGRPDRRPAVRRPHYHRLRPPPRARVSALRPAPGLRLSGPRRAPERTRGSASRVVHPHGALDGDDVLGPLERGGGCVTRVARAADGLEEILEAGRRDHPEHHEVVGAVVVDLVLDVVAEKHAVPGTRSWLTPSTTTRPVARKHTCNSI
jgi:amidase